MERTVFSCSCKARTRKEWKAGFKTVDISMSMALPKVMIIYFDGGCSPNPGQMSMCVVVKSPIGNPEALKMEGLGYGTNNIAEWSSLLWAVSIAKDRAITNPVFLGDSNLVVNQALGKWKINNQTLLSFKQEFMALTEDMDFSINQVPRSRNLAGIFLERGTF